MTPGRRSDVAAVRTHWWYATLAFGIGVALFGLHLGNVFPSSAHDMHSGYGAPVLAFEFARGQPDLIAIFGPDNDPMQVARLAAMRTGNEQDYLYMLLYAAFVASGLIALSHALRWPALRLAIALPVLAALADAYENWLLLDIQAAFTAGDYSPAMASLPWPVAIKFLLLTLANIVIGHALTRFGGGWRLAGILAIVPGIATVLALVMPSAYGWTLAAAIGGGWVVLFGAAAIASLRAPIAGAPLDDPAASPSPPRRRPMAAPPRSFGRRRP